MSVFKNLVLSKIPMEYHSKMCILENKVKCIEITKNKKKTVVFS